MCCWINRTRLFCVSNDSWRHNFGSRQPSFFSGSHSSRFTSLNSNTRFQRLSPGHSAALACQLEAAVPKPGNVHRGADFKDASFYDFIVSGQLLGDSIDRSPEKSLGEMVFLIVERTKSQVRLNTNLGIALLLAPLAICARRGQPLKSESIHELLVNSDQSDCNEIYRAIQMANPGGLGTERIFDVNEAAPNQILKAMELARERDLIARQYVLDFRDVFEFVTPRIVNLQQEHQSLSRSIVQTHVELIAMFSDSLIARKCGSEIAGQAQQLAQLAVDRLPHGWEEFENAVGEMDFWMRSDGNRRNPGATADLIAAGLFVGLWNEELGWPWH